MQRDRVRFLVRASQEHPDAGRLRLFGRDILFTNSPSLVHEVFVEKARQFEKTPQLRILLHLLAGEGLFTAEGDLWKRQRRLMAPIFQPAAIPQFVGIVTDVVARAAARWSPGTVIDVGREMTRITMAVVGKALFDADAFDEADVLGDALTVALEWFNEQVASPRLALQMAVRSLLENAEGRVPRPLERSRVATLHLLRAPLFLPGAYGVRLKTAIARLDGKIQAMIDERRRAAHPPEDLLTCLLRSRDEDGSRMDDRQVRDEAVTLFAAGHETTATALTWAFYELARHPELWSRLAAEADAIRSNEDFRDPARLSYAIKVFKEAMRLYPPVYLLSRRTLEPVRVGPYDLDRHAVVFTSPHSLHRRPDLYPDPERFDPERFAPAAEAARPRSSFLPFGAGPRVCIGNHFALMEGPVALAALAQRLTLTMPPTRIEPAAFATLRPSTPVMATVRPPWRERAAAE